MSSGPSTSANMGTKAATQDQYIYSVFKDPNSEHYMNKSICQKKANGRFNAVRDQESDAHDIRELIRSGVDPKMCHLSAFNDNKSLDSATKAAYDSWVSANDFKSQQTGFETAINRSSDRITLLTGAKGTGKAWAVAITAIGSAILGKNVLVCGVTAAGTEKLYRMLAHHVARFQNPGLASTFKIMALPSLGKLALQLKDHHNLNKPDENGFWWHFLRYVATVVEKASTKGDENADINLLPAQQFLQIMEKLKKKQLDPRGVPFEYTAFIRKNWHRVLDSLPTSTILVTTCMLSDVLTACNTWVPHVVFVGEANTVDWECLVPITVLSKVQKVALIGEPRRRVGHGGSPTVSMLTKMKNLGLPLYELGGEDEI